MKIVKKQYYQQAFDFVRNLGYEDSTNDKIIGFMQNWILEDGYNFDNLDDDYGVYNRLRAVLFPYVVDYYKKTGVWLEDTVFNMPQDSPEYLYLDFTFEKLLHLGYRFKIDIDDVNLLRSVTWECSGKVSDETLDWLIANDCTFEGDCDYTPNFDIKL